MIIKFPKYPFIWNYEDMYNPLEYENSIINLDKEEIQNDLNLSELIKLFPNSIIVEQKQKISISNAKNLSLHTWYLSRAKLFDSDDNSISIESESEIKFKKDVFGFIFDPDDLFDKTWSIQNAKKNSPIYIAKELSNLKIHMIPKIYLHTHNIKGIFRFSPKDNCAIKFNLSNGTKRFYIVLDGLICINNIELVL